MMVQRDGSAMDDDGQQLGRNVKQNYYGDGRCPWEKNYWKGELYYNYCVTTILYWYCVAVRLIGRTRLHSTDETLTL